MDVSDSSAICRACLDCSEGLESLEEENGVGLTTRDMLLSFCILHLDENETPSSNLICKECSLETLRAYNFKLKCERSDGILRDRAQSLKKELGENIKEGVISFDYKEDNFDATNIKHESDILNMLNAVNIKVEECESSDGDYDDQDFDHYEDYSTRSCGRKTRRSRLIKSDDEDTVLSKHTKKKTKCSSANKEKIEEVPRKPGRPGRKKKIRPHSELKFIDESATTLGYKKIYECPKCHAFFKTLRMLHKHMIKLHQLVLDGLEHYNSLWEAARDKEGGQDDTKLSDDKVPTLDFKKPKYKCLDCWYMSKSFDAMKKHIIGQHRGERYVHCDECDYKTTHLTMLVRHKRMHSGERRFGCTQCAYRSSSNYQLNLHIAAHHTEHKAFVCDVCASAFKTKLSLLNHMTRVHINKREHICPLCHKGFNMKKDLKNHSVVHTGQRPHVCEHCGMAFTQKANLEKHVRVIHVSSGERPFPCSECSYRGKSIYSLKSHMYKHSRTQHYFCHLCTHKSTTKYALKIHVQRHLGDKSHHCKSCSYSCYDAQTLVVHNRIHTGERPFPCDLCPYRSRTKQRLRNHMKSHLNEQKFSCQHCPYRSNYKSNLIVHLKKNCGRDSRPYTPRKNQAAVNFSLLSTTTGASITTPDDEPRHVDIQLNDGSIENQLKVELSTNNTTAMG